MKTQTEPRVIAEAETQVMLLENKERQRSPAKPRSWERGLDWILPHGLGGSQPCRHLDFAPGLQNWREEMSVV